VPRLDFVSADSPPRAPCQRRRPVGARHRQPSPRMTCARVAPEPARRPIKPRMPSSRATPLGAGLLERPCVGWPASPGAFRTVPASSRRAVSKECAPLISAIGAQATGAVVATLLAQLRRWAMPVNTSAPFDSSPGFRRRRRSSSRARLLTSRAPAITSRGNLYPAGVEDLVRLDTITVRECSTSSLRPTHQCRTRS
jgi:hypothetical protein